MPDIRATATQAKKAGDTKGSSSKSNARNESATAGHKTVAKKAAILQSRVDTKSAVTSEERRRMIAEAAYLKAEKRGFVGGDPNEDWLTAEAEINKILSRM